MAVRVGCPSGLILSGQDMLEWKSVTVTNGERSSKTQDKENVDMIFRKSGATVEADKHRKERGSRHSGVDRKGRGGHGKGKGGRAAVGQG